MANNTPSFRYPFTLPKDTHPQVANALRSAYNSLSDLNQAIEALNTKVGAISPTTSSTSLALAVSGIPNSDQARLNLQSAGSTVILTDLGSGNVNLEAVSSAAASLVGLGSNFPFFNEGGICFGPVATSISNGSYGVLQSLVSGNSTNGTLSALVPTATTPPGIGMNTTTTISSSAGIASHPGSLTGHITLGSLRSIVATLQLTSLAGIRAWFGIGAVQGSAVFQISNMMNDTPNFNFVGFRYSTNAGDLKWQCVTQLDSTHQTTTPESGSHLDTNIHVFEIQFDGVNALFYIDGTQVGSMTGATLPATSAQFCFAAEVDNVGVAVAKQMNCYNVRLALAG